MLDVVEVTKIVDEVDVGLVVEVVLVLGVVDEVVLVRDVLELGRVAA